MFGKMSGIPEFPFDAEHERIIGDVLSHLSISSNLESGNKVSLLPNPSHLDAINPAAMGKARSKMEKGDNVKLCVKPFCVAMFTINNIIHISSFLIKIIIKTLIMFIRFCFDLQICDSD